MKNQTIRREAATAGIPLWRVADALGVTDSTFSRWLRFEFTDEERMKVLAAIDGIRKEREHEVSHNSTGA